LAFGNTVSPPSSTSELYHRITKKKVNTNINFISKIIEAKNEWHWSHLQVHQHYCYTLTRIRSTKRIHKVVIMRFILLSDFIMENIKAFAILCILWNTAQVMVVLSIGWKITYYLSFKRQLNQKPLAGASSLSFLNRGKNKRQKERVTHL